MKLKKHELKQKFTDKEFLAKFQDLFSIRMLFYYSIITQDYSVPPSIGESIVLTAYGNSIFEKLKKNNDYGDKRDHLLKFALLMEFYHEELIIDVLQTNSYLCIVIETELKQHLQINKQSKFSIMHRARKICFSFLLTKSE